MSDFDSERFASIMENLEAVEIRRSALSDELRLDSQYFKRAYLEEDARRRHYENVTVGSQAIVTDGPHGYHEVDETSGISMLTAKSARGWFSARADADFISARTNDANMRSQLAVDDLILSTRGTVGMCALIDASVLPSNIDQDVARITLKDTATIDVRYLLAYINSRFGQDWILRNAAGMVQQGLSLAKVRSMPVPLLSKPFQESMADAVARAYGVRQEAVAKQVLAEATYLDAVGLLAWEPATDLTFEKSFAYVQGRRRLDSDYFSPRVDKILDLLGAQGSTVGAVCSLRKDRFDPRDVEEDFLYLEIGDVTPDGEVFGKRVEAGQAPSRATWYVQRGDVLTSTVRPLRRLSALAGSSEEGAVCSSGFAVFEPVGIESEVLLTYLRLPVVCELMNLHATASMYPAVSPPDIQSLPFFVPDEKGRELIVSHVREAREARRKSGEVLVVVERAIETAIQVSEEEGLRVLRELE